MSRPITASTRGPQHSSEIPRYLPLISFLIKHLYPTIQTCTIQACALNLLYRSVWNFLRLEEAQQLRFFLFSGLETHLWQKKEVSIWLQIQEVPCFATETWRIFFPAEMKVRAPHG